MIQNYFTKNQYTTFNGANSWVFNLLNNSATSNTVYTTTIKKMKNKLDLIIVKH